MNEQKTVLILFADYGYGHRSAALAIQQALEMEYGQEVRALAVNPLEMDIAPGFLRREQDRYDRRVTQTPELVRLGFQIGGMRVTTNLVESSMIVLLYETLRRLLRDVQPDAIVVTYPLFLSPLAALFTMERRNIPVLTAVTDLASVLRVWFNEVAQITAVPTDIVQSLALGYGVPAERLPVTGIPVNPQIGREERSKAEIRAELGWRQDLVTVLAVGSKRVRNLNETLNLLNHSGLPLQLVIAAGGDNDRFAELQAMEWHTTVQLYNFVSDMPVKMRAADVLLCKAGGLVTSEALACGLPLLLVDVIEGNETGNARYVIDKGAGELAANPVHALEILFHWMLNGNELLHTRAKNARRAGRPEAAFEIASLARQLADQGPIKKEMRLLDPRRLTELLNRFNVPWRES